MTYKTYQEPQRKTLQCYHARNNATNNAKHYNTRHHEMRHKPKIINIGSTTQKNANFENKPKKLGEQILTQNNYIR